MDADDGSDVATFIMFLLTLALVLRAIGQH